MGVFKLGKMTFGSLFKKPETIMYPVQVKPQPAGLKGHVALDAQACILCGMCDKSCATNCITVDKQARTWAIDRFQCVQCGYCITVCPKKCLHMDPSYAPASTVRAADVVAVPAQEKAAQAPKAAKTESVSSEAKQADAAPSKAAEEDGVPAEVKKAPVDKALEEKLSLMDADKAEVVRKALSARR